MRFLRLKEILCAMLAVVFILAVAGRVPDSQKTVQQVADSVVSATDTEGLCRRKNGVFKKTFRLNANDYDGVVYYTSDSLMDVREILVVRLADAEQAAPLMEVLRKHVEDKAVLFHGYAPDQEALLDGCVLESSRGFVCLAVCRDADRVRESFYRSL